MPTEDKASDETPGPPHPRRDDRRPPPVIEGTAQEIPDPTAEAAPQDSEPENLAPENLAPAAGDSPEEPAATGKRPYAAAGLLPLAALVLALWALLGAGALWVRTIYASPKPGGQAQIAALATQVGALRAQMATVQSLQSRVATLETAVKSASAAAEAARADAGKALAAANAARAAAVQRAATAKPPASVAAAQSAALAALGERLAALERRPDPQAIANQLSAKISDLDQKAASLAGALDGVDKRVSALAAQAGDQAKRLTPLEALLRAPKVDVAAIDASTAQAVDEAQAAALIVAARALQRAVDSGAPFARETAAAAKLGADPIVLKPLQASAAAGVATSSELSQAFTPLVGPILAGVASPDRGGVFDRLAREAGSLVQIRTVGRTSGNSLPAVVGRIESALARGDVAAALKARDLLPDAAKTMTGDWARRARARLAAEQAAQTLLNGAMDKLGKART